MAARVLGHRAARARHPRHRALSPVRPAPLRAEREASGGARAARRRGDRRARLLARHGVDARRAMTLLLAAAHHIKGPHIDWRALSPILALTAGGIVVLMVGLLRSAFVRERVL